MEYSDLFDSVYVSMYKYFGSPLWQNVLQRQPQGRGVLCQFCDTNGTPDYTRPHS